MGAICMVGASDGELERGYTIIGSGDSSEHIHRLVEIASHDNIPVIIAGDDIKAREIAESINEVKSNDHTVILIDNSFEPHSREELLNNIVENTARDIEKFALYMEYFDDEGNEVNEDKCHDCYYFDPLIISILIRWDIFLSGVPP